MLSCSPEREQNGSGWLSRVAKQQSGLSQWIKVGGLEEASNKGRCELP